jgi:UDP-N-acetylmuramoylalanine--D-glutamate ligase
MIDLTSYKNELNGRPVAVFGMGVSNFAAIRALRALDIETYVWDDNPDNVTEAVGLGAIKADLTEIDLSGFGALILAPGVPLHFPKPHAVVLNARKAGIEILCDIELLARAIKSDPHNNARFVAITGTNGKSTTTALLGHVLSEAGLNVAVGGNIGTAALSLKQAPDMIYVLEISSYQADLCHTFSPDIVIHLNFSPDHIDRHGSMDGYVAAKQSLFRGDGYAIISQDDEWSREMTARIDEKTDRVILPLYSDQAYRDGYVIKEGRLYFGDASELNLLADIKAPNLLGAHNNQNAAAAFIASHLLGIADDVIIEGLQSFGGLPHRQYLTRVINGVPYVNDSKATNAEAAAKALACYSRIFWIVGGVAKEGGLTGLEPYTNRIAKAYLIGASVSDFAKWMDENNVPYIISGTMEQAVMQSHHDAQERRGEPGSQGAVLLSPACASFDQFKNFEDRGNVFTACVMALSEDMT